MTEKQQQSAPSDDAGTGLAPDDLEGVLGELDEQDEQGRTSADLQEEPGGPRTDDGAPDQDDGASDRDAAAPESDAAASDGDGAASDANDGDRTVTAGSSGDAGGSTGSDRQRLAEFARGFGASGSGPPAGEDDGDDTAADDTVGDADASDADDQADRNHRATTDDRTTDGGDDERPAGPDASGTSRDPAPKDGTTTSDDAGPKDGASASHDPAPKDGANASDDAGPARSATLNPGDVYRIVDGKEHRDTAWSRLVARTRELFTGSPAQEEERLDRDLEELRLRGLSKGVTLALGSIKGGAGKTTITLTLAEVLANALRVGVLVVDADLEFGTASDSVPDASRHGGTLVDVHRLRHEITTPGDLAPYLVTLPHGAQLLSGPTDPNDIEKIDIDTMGELMELLRRFYPIILVDLPPGMGLRGSIPRWGFAEADDIVLVTTPRRANVKQMGHMLDYVSERHAGVPLTLAINMVPARLDEAGQRVVGVAQGNGRSRRTAEIPEDHALSRQLDAGALDIAGLDQRTRIAVKDLTYSLASQWCR